MRPILEVTDADIAFPTAQYIPKEDEIPKEFWNGNTIWNKCFRDWFYKGLKSIKEKPGVDRAKALRAIQSIIGSYGPKHEHKEAAVAFLLSEWFESYEPKDS